MSRFQEFMTIWNYDFVRLPSNPRAGREADAYKPITFRESE